MERREIRNKTKTLEEEEKRIPFQRGCPKKKNRGGGVPPADHEP